MILIEPEWKLMAGSQTIEAMREMIFYVKRDGLFEYHRRFRVLLKHNAQIWNNLESLAEGFQ